MLFQTGGSRCWTAVWLHQDRPPTFGSGGSSGMLQAADVAKGLTTDGAMI
jgi:hypothetical protein